MFEIYVDIGTVIIFGSTNTCHISHMNLKMREFTQHMGCVCDNSSLYMPNLHRLFLVCLHCE